MYTVIKRKRRWGDLVFGSEVNNQMKPRKRNDLERNRREMEDPSSSTT